MRLTACWPGGRSALGVDVRASTKFSHPSATAVLARLKAEFVDREQLGPKQYAEFTIERSELRAVGAVTPSSKLLHLPLNSWAIFESSRRPARRSQALFSTNYADLCTFGPRTKSADAVCARLCAPDRICVSVQIAMAKPSPNQLQRSRQRRSINCSP